MRKSITVILGFFYNLVLRSLNAKGLEELGKLLQSGNSDKRGKGNGVGELHCAFAFLVCLLKEHRSDLCTKKLTVISVSRPEVYSIVYRDNTDWPVFSGPNFKEQLTAHRALVCDYTE